MNTRHQWNFANRNVAGRRLLLDDGNQPVRSLS